MKRSSQVALLLMGAASAGASAYALMPSRDCVAPDRPAALAPGAVSPQTLAPGAVQPVSAQAPCEPSGRSSGSGSSHGSGHSSGGSSSSSSTQTSTVVDSHSIASRGGFGSTGHSFSAGG